MWHRHHCSTACLNYKLTSSCDINADCFITVTIVIVCVDVNNVTTTFCLADAVHYSSDNGNQC